MVHFYLSLATLHYILSLHHVSERLHTVIFEALAEIPVFLATQPWHKREKQIQRRQLVKSITSLFREEKATKDANQQ